MQKDASGAGTALTDDQKVRHAKRLKAALAEAAQECGIWWCPEKQKPMAQINGAPMTIPAMRLNGMAPKLRPELEQVLASFQSAVVEKLLIAAETAWAEAEQMQRAER